MVDGTALRREIEDVFFACRVGTLPTELSRRGCVNGANKQWQQYNNQPT